ncbi:MAG: Ig-like domain-containing protein, partial [Oscillospiraceae bacterium]|nr:Ig-like domain-containing protein [Oscillospiraceae bacterium]
MYTPVQDININTGNLILRTGETFQLNAIITPEDATNTSVTWSSSNQEVATINTNGQLTSISPGTSTITANVESNTSSIQITVRETTEEITFHEKILTTGNIITGLNHLDTTVQNLKNKIITDLTIEMYNHQNQLLSDTQNIGTGGRIVFKNEEGETVAEYNVVVFGDVTGDGF